MTEQRPRMWSFSKWDQILYQGSLTFLIPLMSSQHCDVHFSDKQMEVFQD
jgi:hypothetical protein